MKGNVSITAAVIACMAITGCSSDGNTDFAYLNAQAEAEYLIPVRPGYEGRNPYWNRFAKKFIYAPAFDFNEIDGAANYRYTIYQDTAASYLWTADRSQRSENVPASVAKINGTEATGGRIVSWTFTEDSPKKALSPVWGEIPSGYSKLTVEALDKDGNVLGNAGERTFLKDFPFHGPYPSAARSYREAALKGALYVHNMPAVQHWKESTEPDLTYRHNTYPCKIIGATVRAEAFIAKTVPALRKEALSIAEGAAQFLIDQSQPDGAPLAYFPPTYYKGLIASAREENQGTTLTMEAVSAAKAFLDLYDITGERDYFDQALHIADTYTRLQRADGSFPVKVYITSGEPNGNGCAMLHPLLGFLQRLSDQYGITRYGEMQKKGESWMRDVAVERFEMTGQFEDVTVLGLEPYQNLTNCTAAPYASYLLSKDKLSDKDLENARDLIRFSEDQFTHWDALKDSTGQKRIYTPCVYEQYHYRVPVDNSACNVGGAFLSLYEKTGDRLSFEKAKALADAITIVQNPVNGQIPTTWDTRSHNDDRNRTWWINCSMSSIEFLLRMADAINE